jgi:hypothetical protein
MPGISPAKIAFQPSSNWASDKVKMPSVERRPAKNSASLISPGLVTPKRCRRTCENARQMRRLAAGVAGPARQRPVEIDIDDDAAEIEQQRVGGAGS